MLDGRADAVDLTAARAAYPWPARTLIRPRARRPRPAGTRRPRDGEAAGSRDAGCSLRVAGEAGRPPARNRPAQLPASFSLSRCLSGSSAWSDGVVSILSRTAGRPVPVGGRLPAVAQGPAIAKRLLRQPEFEIVAVCGAAGSGPRPPRASRRRPGRRNPSMRGRRRRGPRETRGSGAADFPVAGTGTRATRCRPSFGPACAGPRRLKR